MITSGMALSAHFGNGRLTPDDVAAGIVGAISGPGDRVAWNEHLEVVVGSDQAGRPSTRHAVGVA